MKESKGRSHVVLNHFSRAISILKCVSRILTDMSDARKENENNNYKGGIDEQFKSNSKKEDEQKESEVSTRISDHEAMMNEKRLAQQSRGNALIQREPMIRGKAALKMAPPTSKTAEKQTFPAATSLSGELMHAFSEGMSLKKSAVDNSSNHEKMLQDKLGEMMQYKTPDTSLNWDDRRITAASVSSMDVKPESNEANKSFSTNSAESMVKRSTQDGNHVEGKLSAHEVMVLEKNRVKNDSSLGVRRNIESDQKLKYAMKKAPVQVSAATGAATTFASTGSHGASPDSEMRQAKDREKANRMVALGVATIPNIARASRDTRASSQSSVDSIDNSKSMIVEDQKIKSASKRAPVQISASSRAVSSADARVSSSGTDMTEEKNREKANRMAATSAGIRPGVAWVNHPSQNNQRCSQSSLDSSQAASIESNEGRTLGAISSQRTQTPLLPSSALSARTTNAGAIAEDQDRMIREKRAAIGQLFEWANGNTRDATAASEPTIPDAGPSTAFVNSGQGSSSASNNLLANNGTSDRWVDNHNDQYGKSRGSSTVRESEMCLENHDRSYLREGLNEPMALSMEGIERRPPLTEVSSGDSFPSSCTIVLERTTVPVQSTTDLVSNDGVSLHTEDSNPEIEAQVGLPVIFPGAFAITGMDHENDEGYISADIQSVSTDHPDDDRFLHDDLEEQAPEKEVIETDPFEAILAEAAVTVEGAVIQIDDELDKKTLRRVRTMQYSILILAMCAVALVITSVLGRYSNVPGEKPMPIVKGWTMVGSTVFGPINEARTEFGTALDMTRDGKKVAVVAPGRDDGDVNNVGALYFFTEKEGPNGTEWELFNENLKGPGAQKSTVASLSMSTDSVYIAVGYPDHENGVVMLYKENHATKEIEFDVQLEINTTEPSWFGYSLDLSHDGNTLVIGAPRFSTGNLSQTGAVYAFQRNGTEWVQLGEAIVGEEQDEFSGWSVSVVNKDGMRVAVGSPVFADFTGRVRVFDWTGSSWEQVGESLGGEGDLNRYGDSLDFSHDGKILAVGARGTFYESPGYVTILLEEDGEWVMQGDRIRGTTDGEGFGADIALSKDGNVVAVGAPLNEDFGVGSGSIRVFAFDTALSAWEQLGSSIGGQPRGGYGSSVALDSDGMRLAGGAPLTDFDERVTRAGGVGVFERTQ